jgi:hypothetical protein
MDALLGPQMPLVHNALVSMAPSFPILSILGVGAIFLYKSLYAEIALVA